MRPVRLRMHGFAAFREPTEVDFSDTDYFALVGPTGAGKSTVIDAMTFALYGSVPRWGNRGVVGLALSPTATRGTVELEFDLDRRRYVVARDLRRAASGSVTVREARLERLPESAPHADGADTEVLAHGAGVSKAVEQLLGLPFEQFCMCVVLPQGEFAQLLHVAPAERQKVLTRILGLDLYERMAKQSGLQARDDGQRATLLDQQLARDSEGADEQAGERAEARVAELAALVERVGAALPGLAGHEAAVEQARRAVQTVTAERAALAGLRAPDGLAELGPAAERAERAVAAARAGVDAAETRDTGARERRDRAPDPEPLRVQRDQHAELARVRAELPGRQQALTAATARTGQAREEVAAAEAERDRTRVEREAAEAAQAGLTSEGTTLRAERDRLAAPRPPDGVAELDAEHRRAAAALVAARAADTAAESALAGARAAVESGPDRARLLRARQDHAELGTAAQRRTRARERADAARERLAVAGTALADAECDVEATLRARDDAQRADLAGALRPALAVHHPCPVCEQTVQRLPPLESGVGERLAAAERAWQAATRAREQAARSHRDADREHREAAGELAALDASVSTLRARLTGPDADPDAVERGLADAERLAGTARAAQEQAAAAGRQRDRAEQGAQRAADRVERGWRTLRAARDPLVALGAPAVDTTPAETAEPGPTVEAGPDGTALDGSAAGPDAGAGRTGGGAGGAGLADGWRILTEWAAGEVAARDARLAALRTAFTEVAARRAAAGAADETAGERLRAARAELDTAVRAEQDAAGRHRAALEREAELAAALEGAPDAAEVTRRLAELAALDAEVRAAGTALRAARAALTEATAESGRQADRVREGWRGLHAARDPLVALGAPGGAVGGGGTELVAAWAALVEWAGSAAAERDERLARARREQAGAEQRRDTAHRELVEDLGTHGLELPAGRPLAHAAAPAASAALEQARAEVRRLADQRRRTAQLRTDRDAARESEQVARLLAELLGSKNFPRWLVASALDTLVVDASRTLSDLSGGQFELTHADGEFLVVDHTDADARRPVKTLSGGETFQASLALALALSEQLSGMASAGAARLDSIFLDEGFGTLDEANLDVVAATLENLAAHRDRMVGVITHVPALAERVPVRFAVTRDQRTASISREEVS